MAASARPFRTNEARRLDAGAVRLPHVLVQTPWFPARPGRREGNYIFDSVDALTEYGVRCSVLVTRAWAPGALRHFTSSAREDAPDPRAFPRIDDLQQCMHLSIPRYRLRPVSNRLLDRQVIPRLIEMAKCCGADVIHAHTEHAAAPAVAAGREVGLPVVVTLHGIDMSRAGLYGSGQRRRISAALGAANRVILVGESLRPFFRDYLGQDNNFCVVPNGFSLDPVRRVDAVLALGRPVRFISVSNLHQGKGVDVTLKALAALQARGFGNWSYQIVGDGAERASLETLVRRERLSDRVKFAGAVPPGAVAGLLAAADVFVLPSAPEAFGIAYLEAMAAGLLTVGVRGEGPSMFIEDGETGLLVAPRDAEELSVQLAGIFDKRERMRAIAAAGKARAHLDFSWARHAERLLGVYREVVGGTAHR